MNYFCFVGIRTRDNIVQQSAATATFSPLRHRSHILLLHCLVHLIILRLLHSGSLSDASLLLLVHGETLTQRQALHDFYGATNGGGTAWTSTCSAGGWKAMGTSPPLTFCNNATTSPYSTYYGITCSAPNGRIVALDLSSCRLKGTLTASLSALTDLNSLWLNSNELSGTLPPQWSAMSALQNLALNSNQLIGSLPPQWSAMSSLERLWLYSNNLSGMLPPQWPEGMRSVRLTSFFCTASCSGVVGVDANCLGFSPFH